MNICLCMNASLAAMVLFLFTLALSFLANAGTVPERSGVQSIDRYQKEEVF